MDSAVEKLTSLVADPNRYDIPNAEIRDLQVEAMNERFQERKDMIKLLGHRAKQAGITEVRSYEDMVPLLFPHTAYKSYPESFLMEEKWDRLGKWLDTVASHRVPPQDPATIKDVDDWVEKLQENAHYVSCSSGTTGKSAMLVASTPDMEWCKKEAAAAYSWGSGVKPAQDRRMVSTGSVAVVPCNQATGKAYQKALQDPIRSLCAIQHPRLRWAA